MEAVFCFQRALRRKGGAVPDLRGGAAWVKWKGVEFQNLSQRNRQDFPLGSDEYSMVFYRPGRSYLEVEALAPKKAAWAEIQVRQCVAVRAMAPYAGRAQVRLSLVPIEGYRYGPTGGKGPQTTERTYLGRSSGIPCIHAERTFVEGKPRLRFRVEYLNGDTTWRLMYIRILFRGKDTLPEERNCHQDHSQGTRKK